MNFWSTKPILKILVSFMSGIVLYPFLALTTVLATALITIMLLMARGFLTKYHQFRLHLFYGLLIHLLLLSAGYLDMYYHDIRMNPQWFGNGRAEKKLVVRINGPVRKKTRYYQSTVEVRYTFHDNRWHPAKGNLLLYLPVQADSPIDGDVFYIDSKILPVPPPKKGSTFDYAAFLALKNIYHNGYPKPGEFEKIGRRWNAFAFYSYIEQLRNRILAILDRYITTTRENGLAKALLIGYRDNLDKEIISAYTNTGVIHVIAISGLHLGLLYAILAWILKFPSGNQYFHLSRSVFIAAFLWIFSILCGASPSVLRSALMFTCLLAGEAMQKENYTANALAASAFILLCFDPNLIRDIGFQLSYAAVGSLLVYNRYISRMYRPANAFISMAWNSIATSISAQVLTTPLILFHFHQFPVLFILANLVAVPLSGVILVLLILLCILSSFPLIASPVGWLTYWLSYLMNLQISRLNEISFAVISDIRTGLADSILFYACIALASLWLASKKPWTAIALLSVILAWLAISRYRP